MFKTLIRRLVPLAVVLAFAMPAAAQDQPAQDQAAAVDYSGTGTISGVVVGGDRGRPVRDAVVKLRHQDLDAGPDLETGRDGKFSATNLKAGPWSIQIEAKGYGVRRLTTQVPEGGAAEPVSVNLGRQLSDKDVKEMQKLLEAGNQLFASGDFAGARAEYEKVLAERPEFTAVHRSIAFTYGREGNHAKALEHLDMVLAEDAANVELLTLAVSSAVETNNMAKVNEYLDALMTSDVEVDSLANVAVSLMQKGKTQEAADLLGRIMQKHPSAPLPYYFRALAHLKLEKVPEAKADLEKFVELAPPDAPQVAQAKDLIGKLANAPTKQ